MSVDDTLRRHADLWHGAVHHRFLDGVRDGSLPGAAFDTWLVQDHHFVTDLAGFQARLLDRAPADAAAVLDAGLGALREELAWFAGLAERRALDLGQRRLPATRQAQRLLAGLDEAPAATALTGLWAVERAYLDAWTYAAPGAPELREYVEHWTTTEFEAYVAGLAQVSDTHPADSDRVVLDVAAMEHDFWEMAWDAGVSRPS